MLQTRVLFIQEEHEDGGNSVDTANIELMLMKRGKEVTGKQYKVWCNFGDYRLRQREENKQDLLLREEQPEDTHDKRSISRLLLSCLLCLLSHPFCLKRETQVFIAFFTQYSSWMNIQGLASRTFSFGQRKSKEYRKRYETLEEDDKREDTRPSHTSKA